MKKFNSGEIAPKSGVYNVVDAKGSQCGTVKVKKGDRIPPTHDSSHHFEID